MSSTPVTTPAGRWERALTGPAAAALLLAAFWVVMLAGLAGKSLTFDEGAYAVSGCSYWKFSDYRLNPEAGPLPQRLAGLPLAVAGYRFPSTRSEDWRTSRAQNLGHEFFYGLGNDADRMAALGRGACGLLAVALGAVVWAWSRRLFGPAGGMISLLLCVLNPGVLANGALMTSDTAAALFFAAATWAWWAVLQRVTPGRVLGAGLLAGCLFVSKMSAVLILPVMIILAAVRALGEAPLPAALGGRECRVASRRGRAAVLAAAFVAAGATVAGVLWAFYGFRFAVFAAPGDGSHLQFDWSYVLDSPAALPMRLIDLARRHALLPEPWLYGLGIIVHRSEFSHAYWNGDTSATGWAGYFPYLFVVKTPLPFLGVLALALAARPARGAPARSLLPLWVLVGTYGLAAIASRMNIGHRYLLPIYPPLFVIAGAAAAWLGRPVRGAAAALCVLLAAHAAETAWRFPDMLAYFNGLVRPAEAYRHVVDSSLDWGQDLPAVRTYIDGHPGQAPFYLSYFGAASPAWHGVRARPLYSFGARYLDGFEDIVLRELPRDGVPAALQRLRGGMPDHDLVGIDRQGGVARAVFLRKAAGFRLDPGTYLVSATMLQSVCDWEVRGPWTAELEKTYRDLERSVAPLLGPDEAARIRFLSRNGVETARLALYEFQKHRMAKLAAWLRGRRPDANLHGSILVYRLTEADLAQALPAAGAR